MKREIVLLAAAHDVGAFTCGNDWLDKYLRHHVVRNQSKGYGRTFVAVRREGPARVDGYYTVSMSSVQFSHLPDALHFGAMPKYPMPAAHLGCLAVAADCQRQGLGSILLIDALRRMIAASEMVAARAVDVKAIDDAARDWYADYGFLPFRDLKGPPYHLYLPLDTARAIVAAAGG